MFVHMSKHCLCRNYVNQQEFLLGLSLLLPMQVWTSNVALFVALNKQIWYFKLGDFFFGDNLFYTSFAFFLFLIRQLILL